MIPPNGEMPEQSGRLGVYPGLGMDRMSSAFGGVSGLGGTVGVLPKPQDDDAITPDNLARLLNSDNRRLWAIDIETDSTIQADQADAQRNMAGFVQGLASFTAAVGPGVQAGLIPKKSAADLLKAFARAYKLGRSAEEAIEEIGEQDEEGEQGNAPPPPDPKTIEAQAAQQKAQMQAEADKQAMALKSAKAQQDAQLSQAQFQAKMAELQQEMVLTQRQMQADMEKLQQEMIVSRQEMQAAMERLAMDRETMARKRIMMDGANENDG